MGEKYCIIYADDSGDICFNECNGMAEVSEILEHQQECFGQVTFGHDIMHGEVLVIKGKKYIPEPVSVVNLWK